jgi:hypothetical protein
MRPDPDRPIPPHPRGLCGIAAALLGAALIAAAAGGIRAAVAAAADSGSYAIAIAANGSGKNDTLLSISGSWPTACTPTFDKASLSRSDLRIDARAVLNLCARQRTPYSIELNPRAALGQTALAPSVYHVYYYAANGAQAEPQLRAFALVNAAAGAGGAAFAPETGFWWTTGGDKAAARNVLSIEAQGPQLTVALMSYDADGRGSWQFGTGSLSGRIAHVPLLQIAGGKGPFSAASAGQRGEAGWMLDLEFQSSSLASAWLSRPLGGEDSPLQVQTVDLVRLPFAKAGDGSAWKGDWILVMDAGTTAPQRLHLDHVEALDAATFRLGDDAAGIYVDCGLDGSNAELPPSRCILRRRDGGELGQFTAIAITRMDGALSNGAALHLLRVSQ